MDWAAAIGVGLAWALGLFVLAVALNYALHGLSYCSLKRLGRLSASAYVVRRLERTDRIRCDGRRLSFAPRAESGRPDLAFGVDVFGLPAGAFAQEVWLEFIRGQILRRFATFTAVVVGLIGAWAGLFAFYPSAASNFFSRIEGTANFSLGGQLFIALLVLSALFVVHTYYPFRFSILPQFWLSPREAKNETESSGEPLAPGASKERVAEGAEKPKSPSESFKGSEETLSDLDRFCPLVHKVLGDHEAVYISYYYRAFTLFHLRRFEGAVADIDQFVDAQTRALGRRNVWTMKVRYLRAVNLAFLGNWPAAMAELESLAPVQADVLGPAHPDTLMTRSARVTAWAAQERHADVLQELETLQPDLMRVFGTQHEFTQSNARLQAIALEKLKQFQKHPDEEDDADISTKVLAPERVSRPAFAAAQAMIPASGSGSEHPMETEAETASRPYAGPRASPSPVRAGPIARTPASWAGPQTPRRASETQSAATSATPSGFSNFPAARPAPRKTNASRKTLAVRASVAVAGLALLVGVGLAAPWVWRSFAGLDAPSGEVSVEAADGSVMPLPLPEEAPLDAMMGEPTEEGGLDTPTEGASMSAPVVEERAFSHAMRTGGDGANVRATPNTEGALVVRLGPGSALSVTGETRVAGYRWFQVTLPGGRLGYVREDVVVGGATPQPTQVEDFTAPAPMVAGRDGANVRAAPRTGASLVARLDAGSELRITGRSQADGHAWYRVALANGRIGFVRGDVVAQQQASAAPIPQPPDGSEWIDMASVTWRRRASRAEMIAAYPPQNWANGTPLAVEVQCKVGAGGRLSDCSLLSEAPSAEIAAAALRIIGYYRLAPSLSDGTRAQGRWLRLRVRFDPPESAGE